MKRFFGKLGFVHRRLWGQDGGYRVALLLGPASLLGAGLAVAFWASVTTLEKIRDQAPAWAVPPVSQALPDDASHPLALQAARPLPQVGPDGGLFGHESGSNVVARPIQVSETMDVDIKTNSLAGLAIKGSDIDMAQILDAGLKGSLYVAVGTGFFVAREPGVYAFCSELTGRHDKSQIARADEIVR